MAFRPKLSEVSDELREQATQIRNLGNIGLFAVFILLFVILWVDITSGWSKAVDGMYFGTPRGSTVPIVVAIGIVCDVIAISLLRSGRSLKTDAKSDPAALQIGKSATLFGGIGVAMIFIGPYLFGWLLLGAGTN